MMKIKRLFSKFRVCLKSLTNIESAVDVAAADLLIRRNVVFRGPNIFILFCAIIIASVGLNVNSIPVIIGAMLVSPLMGPILGFGLSLGTNDTGLLKESLKNLGVMVGISLVASTLYFAITPLRMGNPSELLARTNPTIYDVLIAFFGGGAGIIETARRERGTVLSGVAIATALMPPLCTIGYGVAQLNWQYALGAFYLFCINGIFIALATFLGVKYLHFPTVHFPDVKRQRRLRWTMSIAILLVMVPSVLTAITVVRQNNFERSVEMFVSSNSDTNGGIVADYAIRNYRRSSDVVLYLSVDTISADLRDSVLMEVSKYDIDQTHVILRTKM